MGQATVYCEICGEMIPEQDFAKGKAIHHEGKNYCPKCRGQVPDLPAAEPPGSGVHQPGSGVYKSSPSPYPSVRRVSGVFQPAAVGKATVSGVKKRSSSGIQRAITAQVVKPATPSQGQRVVSGEDAPRPDTTRARRKPTEEPGSKKTLLIAAAIIGAIVIVVVAVMAINASAEKKKAEEQQKRHDKASAQLDELRKVVDGVAKKSAATMEDFEGAANEIKDNREVIDKANDSEFSSEVNKLQGKIDGLKKAFQVEKEREDSVARVVAEAEKDLANYELNLTKLAQILKSAPDAPAVLGEKVKSAIVDLRQKGVRDLLTRLSKSLTAPNPPYDAMVAQLAKLMESCDGQDSLIKEIQVEIEMVKKAQDSEIELMMGKLSSDTDMLCAQKKFDEAIKKVETVGHDWEQNQKAYSQILKLRSELIERKKRESSGGGGSGGNNGNNGNAGNASKDKEIVLFNGSDTSGWQQKQTTNGDWTVDPAEKSLKGVNKQGGSEAPEKALWILRNDPVLEDFDLTFEVRNVRGGGFMIIARVGPSGGAVVNLRLSGGSDWIPVRLEYRGLNVSLQSGNNRPIPLQLKPEQNGSGKGLVGLGLQADQSAEFRNITVVPR